MNVMILGIRRKTANEQQEPPVQHTGCGCAEGGSGTPEATTSVKRAALRTSVITLRGQELVDIVNILRDLGAPEDSVIEAVSSSLAISPWRKA